MRSFILTLVLVSLAAVGRAAAPVEFDGFGLGNFEGTGSIAGELERIEAARERENFGRMPELAVAMQGPVGRDAPPAPMSRRPGHTHMLCGLLPARVTGGASRYTGK